MVIRIRSSRTISGLKNGDPIYCHVASIATARSPVGQYAIVPTLLDPTASWQLHSTIPTACFQ